MKRSVVVPHPADPGNSFKERAVDIVIKRQAVKPKVVVPKLVPRLEPIDFKPMDIEAFRRHQRYMANVEKIAGKTWPEVAAEFEAEMDAERSARFAASKNDRSSKGGR